MLAYVKADLAQWLADILPGSVQAAQLRGLLQRVRNPKRGHLALPVFALAGPLKKNPIALAQEWLPLLQQALKACPLVNHLQKESLVTPSPTTPSPTTQSPTTPSLATQSPAAPTLVAVVRADFNAQNTQVSQMGGFINFRFSDVFLQQALNRGVLQGDAKQIGNKIVPASTEKHIVIDFASPNVAKPMHIGHLRASVIGQCIVNLAHTQGHKTVGLNHLGDWGVQFGKLIWAYKKWGDRAAHKLSLEDLYALYVHFHQEAKEKPELDALGSAEFKKLEQGDPAALKLWREFVDTSMREYNKLWQLLHVRHDKVLGESFYNDQLLQVKNKLQDMGLLVEDQGARVVKMPDDLPPCLIEKTDGASLYATRDLASAIYRFEHLKASENLYVVGSEQKLHFKQVFCVLQKMGFKWADKCRHIVFGRYCFKDKRLSSRDGQVVRLKAVLDGAFERVLKRLNDNPETQSLDKNEKTILAQQIAYGAVVFNDLKTDRIKDVEFDWNKILSLKGDTGPYVQYAGVRCQALMRKYGMQLQMDVQLSGRDKLPPSEQNLILELLQFADSLQQAFQNYKPHIVAGYLIDVCKAFNQFYAQCPILNVEDKGLQRHRMTLVKATYLVLRRGLQVLGIQMPKQM